MLISVILWLRLIMKALICLFALLILGLLGLFRIFRIIVIDKSARL